MKTRIECLKNTPAASAKVLILGTLPGPLSLKLGQYYANPSNTFWDIIEKALGIPRTSSYPSRVKRLTRQRIALWDVLASAERRNSKDSAIRNVAYNDFARFLLKNKSIELVCFNGKKSAKYYGRWMRKNADRLPRKPSYETLPSTSKANTSMTAGKRLRRWKKIL
ncbi:MAG: DNA-deoxyinosine glycosylase [Gammaproteobacteria bacterium]